jgi:hypothetical protein
LQRLRVEGEDVVHDEDGVFGAAVAGYVWREAGRRSAQLRGRLPHCTFLCNAVEDYVHVFRPSRVMNFPLTS